MLSTNVKLQCNANKVPKHPYFQYPIGVNPGDLAPLPVAVVSFLPEDSVAHQILLEFVPLLMGVIIFTFFLISSGFILYGVIRGLYTDYMLPRRKKVLQKLGKLREEKRRKHFRRVKKTKEIKSSLGGKPMTGRESIFEPHLTRPTPHIWNPSSEFSEGESSTTDGPIKKIFSYTTPPVNVDKNSVRPIVHKPLKIPGRPFPVLPDAPLNKNREVGTSPKPGVRKKKSKKKIPVNEKETFRPVFVFPVPDEVRKAWDQQREKTRKSIENETKKAGKKNKTGVGVGTIPGNADMENTVERLKAKRAQLKEERLAQAALDGGEKKKMDSAKVSPMPATVDATVSNPPMQPKTKGKTATLVKRQSQ